MLFESQPSGDRLSPTRNRLILFANGILMTDTEKTAIVTPATTGGEVVVYIRLQCELQREFRIADCGFQAPASSVVAVPLPLRCSGARCRAGRRDASGTTRRREV